MKTKDKNTVGHWLNDMAFIVRNIKSCINVGQLSCCERMVDTFSNTLMFNKMCHKNVMLIMDVLTIELNVKKSKLTHE
jgi:hypothetical protein